MIQELTCRMMAESDTQLMGLIEAKVKELGGAMIQLQAVNDDMHNSFYGKLNYRNCTNLVLKSKWL